tara:strand:+ start:197 stop:568 length:372 start_codon:yes stop_codon:yes gene_type:complete
MKNTFDDENVKEIDKLFRLVPHPQHIEDEKKVCVEISEGPFSGTILEFGKFSLNAKENEELTADYEYDIIYVPEDKRDVEYTDEEGEEFESMVGDILMSFIYKQFKEKEEHGQDREPDTITLN